MRALIPFLTLLLASALLAGCCCPRADGSSVVGGVDATEPGGREVFIDVMTVRIPEANVASALGAHGPLTGEAAIPLDKRLSEDLLAGWKQHPDVRIVQAPKMLTREGHEATISIGETIRFAKTTRRGGARDSALEIVEDPESPVFVGYRLRVTARIDDERDRIAVELDETARDMRTPLPGAEIARMGAADFLRDAVVEQSLRSAFEIESGGHVLIGSPTVYEDAEGRFVRVSLFHATVLRAGPATRSSSN